MRMKNARAQSARRDRETHARGAFRRSQAYVFTVLTASYVQGALAEEH